MDTKIKISVTIPAYKSFYLKNAIKSVLDQTYNLFELIIVNDASPENLEEIVSSFNDKRIKYYVNNKNCGALNVVDNWNICLSYATGDYIICMGDDDILCKNCLEEYIKLINQYPDLNVYHGRTEIINENSEFIRLTEARPEFETVYSLIWHRWRGRSQYIGDFLFRTDVLRQKGGFYKLPLAWGSDDLTAFLLAADKGIANTIIPIFQYRVNSHTITNNGNIAQKLEAIKIEREFISQFIDKLEPNNELDLKYKLILKSDIKRVFKRKKIDALSEYMQSKTFYRLINLLNKHISINVSIKIIFISFFKSIINNYKKQLL